MKRWFKIACTATLICIIWGLAVPAFGYSQEEERAAMAVAGGSEDAVTDPEAGGTGALEKPGEKKAAKKFPWLLAGAAAAAVVTAVLLLTGKKKNPGNGGDIEYGTVTDIDGNVYRTVKIGAQWWMAENLHATRYSDGAPVESQVYDNDPANLAVYGRLYSWYATMRMSEATVNIPGRVQGVSPEGWHIPSEAEWMELINTLGGEAAAGGKLKEAGTAHWFGPNTGATNEAGFTAVPSGNSQGRDEGFGGLGSHCFLSVATGFNSGGPTVWLLRNNSAAIRRAGLRDVDAIAVRCLRD